ncbi:unnamed protein product [Linum trigynum]|uniref:Uncharacterized protein n=1 Tax=Linum trigynum TaxID=586398 RepID=A0AAV2FFS3_9ROSI
MPVRNNDKKKPRKTQSPVHLAVAEPTSEIYLTHSPAAVVAFLQPFLPPRSSNSFNTNLMTTRAVGRRLVSELHPLDLKSSCQGSWFGGWVHFESRMLLEWRFGRKKQCRQGEWREVERVEGEGEELRQESSGDGRIETV